MENLIKRQMDLVKKMKKELSTEEEKLFKMIEMEYTKHTKEDEADIEYNQNVFKLMGDYTENQIIKVNELWKKHIKTKYYMELIKGRCQIERQHNQIEFRQILSEKYELTKDKKNAYVIKNKKIETKVVPLEKKSDSQTDERKDVERKPIIPKRKPTSIIEIARSMSNPEPRKIKEPVSEPEVYEEDIGEKVINYEDDEEIRKALTVPDELIFE